MIKLQIVYLLKSARSLLPLPFSITYPHYHHHHNHQYNHHCRLLSLLPVSPPLIIISSILPFLSSLLSLSPSHHHPYTPPRQNHQTIVQRYLPKSLHLWSPASMHPSGDVLLHSHRHVFLYPYTPALIMAVLRAGSPPEIAYVRTVVLVSKQIASRPQCCRAKPTICGIRHARMRFYLLNSCP